MELISLSQARSLGLKRYFTGEPCRHGHISERLVSNMGCIECAYARTNKWYVEKKVEVVARKAAYRTANRNAINERKRLARQRLGGEYLAYRRADYRKNVDREKARAAAYRAANPEKVKQRVRKWQESNRHVKSAIQMRREAAKKKATPKWADQARISEIYKAAADISLATGIKHEVDHYYPLVGRDVCGLHVHENLRVLKAEENRKKSNRNPDSP